eukprot:m.258765 g.258765  ORF g.258765 m.258765 type:complete len:909 (-) comp19650_c0_seq4:266-2992(-)
MSQPQSIITIVTCVTGICMFLCIMEGCCCYDISLIANFSEATRVPPTVIGVELEGVGHSIYGGGLYSQLVFDESFEDPRDDPAKVDPPTSRKFVTFDSFAAAITSMRHCQAQLFSTRGGKSDNEDFQFSLVPALNGSSDMVSIQSVNYPTYYVAPIDGAGSSAIAGGLGRLGVLNARDPRQPRNFNTLATFKIVAGLGNSSLSSVMGYDGRFVATSTNLTGLCAGHYDAPSADVWLLSPSALGSPAQATWIIQNVYRKPSSHWTYGATNGEVAYTDVTPFHGKTSLNLECTKQGKATTGAPQGAWCAAASNKNVYRRGIAVQEGKPYDGYVFLRSLNQSVQSTNGTPHALDATVVLSLAEFSDSLEDWVTNHTVLDSVVFSVPVETGWTQYNFTLTPSASNTNAAFVVALATPGQGVGVDMAFLEMGAWGRYEGMHLRRDVVRRLLLLEDTDSSTAPSVLRSLRFDGTSVVANPNYLWEHARGPAWLRPPRYGDCWYEYISNGFGMFEAMEMSERAGLSFVTIGINVRAETPTSMSNFIDYCFANTSTPYGALRAADGHAEPYASTLVVELGNEESNADYAARAVPIAAAMRQRIQLVAPAAASSVRFAVAFNDWTRNWTLGPDMVRAMDGHPELLTWDQHDRGTIAGTAQAESHHDAMVAWLRTTGWTGATPMYIGETNCATSREECAGIARALTYGLYTNFAARKGYVGSVSPAVWAYSTCDAEGTICGASDGHLDWPQASIIITPNSTIAQPSWYAHRMIGSLWGDSAARVRNQNSTAKFACAPGDAGVLDVLVVRNATDEIWRSNGPHDGTEVVVAAAHVVSTCSSNTSIGLNIASSPSSQENLQPCKRVAARLLAANSADSVNSVANPTNTVPKIMDVVATKTGVTFVAPAGALVVVPICALT